MNIYEQLNKIDDEESLKEASELTNYQKIMRALDDMDDSKTIDSASKGAHTEVDASSSSKSTKDLVEAAKRIIADLESKGFVKSDIATIGTMIKGTIDSQYPGYVSPRNKIKKAFPDLNI